MFWQESQITEKIPFLEKFKLKPVKSGEHLVRPTLFAWTELLNFLKP